MIFVKSLLVVYDIADPPEARVTVVENQHMYYNTVQWRHDRATRDSLQDVNKSKTDLNNRPAYSDYVFCITADVYATKRHCFKLCIYKRYIRPRNNKENNNI